MITIAILRSHFCIFVIIYVFGINASRKLYKRDAVILDWFGLNALKSVNNGRKNDDKE